jgi:hypothetical protein
VLSQRQVADGDELAAFAPVLDTLPDLRDAMITADALHCQRAHADYLHHRGAHYLFTVKANQPTLRTALARLPWAQVAGLRERSGGHGRTESRSIKVLDLDGTPEARLFPHGARAIKVVRRRHRASQTRPSVETLRDHLPGPPRRRPAASGWLDPLPLDDRELAALGPRRHRG